MVTQHSGTAQVSGFGEVEQIGYTGGLLGHGEAPHGSSDAAKRCPWPVLDPVVVRQRVSEILASGRARTLEAPAVIRKPTLRRLPKSRLIVTGIRR